MDGDSGLRAGAEGIVVGKYLLGRVLSKGPSTGAGSELRLATHAKSKELVALKIMQKEWIFKNDKSALVRREIDIMRGLDHPCVVKFVEVFNSKTNVFVAMEAVEGRDLREELMRQGRLDEERAKGLFRQLMTAVEYLHSIGVAHRDIKLENVLLSEDGTRIKVANYALSVRLENWKGGEAQQQQTTATVASGVATRGIGHRRQQSALGAPEYAAPEAIDASDEQSYDPRGIDLWCAGICLFALSTGDMPFQASNVKRTLDAIRTKEPRFPKLLSPHITDLLKGLLRKDPSTRLTVVAALSHPWTAAAPGANPTSPSQRQQPGDLEELHGSDLEAVDVSDLGAPDGSDLGEPRVSELAETQPRDLEEARRSKLGEEQTDPTRAAVKSTGPAATLRCRAAPWTGLSVLTPTSKKSARLLRRWSSIGGGGGDSSRSATRPTGYRRPRINRTASSIPDLQVVPAGDALTGGGGGGANLGAPFPREALCSALSSMEPVADSGGLVCGDDDSFSGGAAVGRALAKTSESGARRGSRTAREGSPQRMQSAFGTADTDSREGGGPPVSDISWRAALAGEGRPYSAAEDAGGRVNRGSPTIDPLLSSAVGPSPTFPGEKGAKDEEVPVQRTSESLVSSAATTKVVFTGFSPEKQERQGRPASSRSAGPAPSSEPRSGSQGASAAPQAAVDPPPARETIGTAQTEASPGNRTPATAVELPAPVAALDDSTSAKIRPLPKLELYPLAGPGTGAMLSGQAPTAAATRKTGAKNCGPAAATSQADEPAQAATGASEDGPATRHAEGMVADGEVDWELIDTSAPAAEHSRGKYQPTLSFKEVEVLAEIDEVARRTRLDSAALSDVAALSDIGDDDAESCFGGGGGGLPAAASDNTGGVSDPACCIICALAGDGDAASRDCGGGGGALPATAGDNRTGGVGDPASHIIRALACDSDAVSRDGGSGGGALPAVTDDKDKGSSDAASRIIRALAGAKGIRGSAAAANEEDEGAPVKKRVSISRQNDGHANSLIRKVEPQAAAPSLAARASGARELFEGRGSPRRMKLQPVPPKVKVRAGALEGEAPAPGRRKSGRAIFRISGLWSRPMPPQDPERRAAARRKAGHRRSVGIFSRSAAAKPKADEENRAPPQEGRREGGGAECSHISNMFWSAQPPGQDRRWAEERPADVTVGGGGAAFNEAPLATSETVEAMPAAEPGAAEAVEPADEKPKIRRQSVGRRIVLMIFGKNKRGK